MRNLASTPGSPNRALVHVCIGLTAAACVAPSTAVEPGLHVENMNLAADPGVDFYEYANGGWLRANPVPAAESSYGVFSEVRASNQAVLRAILDESAADVGAPPGSPAQQIGAYYASGMNTARIEQDGAAPLAQWLTRIAGAVDVSDVFALLPDLHRIGADAFFAVGSIPDFDDSAMMMAIVAQAGMGLPERGYYFRDDERAVRLREAYVDHVARMLALLDGGDGGAVEDAQTVMAFETELARDAFTVVELRKPELLKNRVALIDADAHTSSFSWSEYFAGHDVQLALFNLTGPDYFATLDRLLTDTPIEVLRTYLRWRLASAYATSLNEDFATERFAFYGRELFGQAELPPRWRRVLDAANEDLGEALGQEFVARAFSPEAKRRAEAMVDGLIAAFRERLKTREWMSSETKGHALAKLDALRTKIGYPDEWRDDSALSLARDVPFAENRMRAREHRFRWELSRIGQPTDEGEWEMTPQAVNAYYHALRNEIVFPAGILQPPFFSEHVDDAVNYGAMGAVIGHEITHGFDNAGSRFDAQGRLRNWWTEADRAEFERRAQKLREQYDAYEVLDGLHVNGELTLGENIADLGGVTIALEAFQRQLAGTDRVSIDGFTPEQRFFLAYAQAWRSNDRPEALRLRVDTSVHAPSKFRVLGPLSHLPEFARAFGLADDAPIMRSADAQIEIW